MMPPKPIDALQGQVFEKNIANSNFKILRESNALDAFVTEDSELLRQYYAMRHTAFRDENGFDEYDGGENKYDVNGHIMVAVRGGEVVGGARIMFSDECGLLSNEIPDTEFCYSSIVKKYDKRENIIYSEISSVVVKKSERDGSVSRKLLEIGLKKAQEHGAHYLCGVAMAIVCRDYRRRFSELGYQIEIIMNYLWKRKAVYNFAKLFPMYIKIS